MRGKILLLLGLSSFLAGCATRIPIRSLAWVDDLKIGSANVRAFDMNRHFPMPEVEVSINGRIASLELDTGTPHGFMLTDASAEEYGLEVLGVVRELNADGSDRGSDSQAVMADEVVVLGVATSRVRGTVASWRVFSSFPFEGTISPEMLGERRVVIDYRNRYLGLSDAGTPEDLSREANCVVRTLPIPPAYGGNVYIPGSVGGRDFVIYLDTGSSDSGVDPKIFETLGLESESGGGLLWAKDLEFSIGGHEFKLRKAAVEPIRRGVAFDKPVGMALGADFLKDYILSIDSVGERKIVISRYPSPL